MMRHSYKIFQNGICIRSQIPNQETAMDAVAKEIDGLYIVKKMLDDRVEAETPIFKNGDTIAIVQH